MDTSSSSIRTYDILITNQLLYQLIYAGEGKVKIREFKVKTEAAESHRNFCTCPSDVLVGLVRLLAHTRICRERFGRLQIFDHCAEIDRLGIEGFIFCDLRPIQHLEPVPLEHFLPAPTFEGDDLAVNAFLARAIQITQIRAHERARR